MAALGVGALVTFLPWALLSPVIAGGGPLTRCAPSCPESVVQIASWPAAAQTAGNAETYLALTLVADRSRRFDADDLRSRRIATSENALGPAGWIADRLVLDRYMPRLLRQCNSWLKASLEARS